MEGKIAKKTLAIAREKEVARLKKREKLMKKQELKTPQELAKSHLRKVLKALRKGDFKTESEYGNVYAVIKVDRCIVEKEGYLDAYWSALDEYMEGKLDKSRIMWQENSDDWRVKLYSCDYLEKATEK